MKKSNIFKIGAFAFIFSSLLFTSCETEVVNSPNSDLQKTENSGEPCSFQPYG